MELTVEILLALLLVAAGYAAAVRYIRECPLRELKCAGLKPVGRSRVLYLIGALVMNALVICSFRIKYPEFGLIHQCKLLCLINTLIAAAAIDYRKYKIPNGLLLGALALRAVIYVIEFCVSVRGAWSDMKGDLLAAVILMAFFFLITLVFKNSIGMGDVKLMGLMGLYQGIWGSINAVLYSMIVSFFVALTLLILKKKKKDDVIPFGPCIMAGTLLSMVLTGI